MKKILTSLPAKLLLGIIVGIVIGLIVPESVLKVLVPIKNIMGQVINFIVPLIIIGFIAPSSAVHGRRLRSDPHHEQRYRSCFSEGAAR